MLGWKIFAHSIEMLMNNRKEAIKISLPVIVAYTLTHFWSSFPVASGVGQKVPDGTALGVVLAISIFTIFASLWTAVGWHRFVLLEEYPRSLPAFHGSRMLAYLSISLLVGLAVFVAAGVTIFMVAVVFSSIPLLGIALTVLIAVVALWAFYRLSPLLPATALGKSMRFAEAWNMTKPISKSVLVTAVVASVAFFALGFLNEQLLRVVPVLGLVTSIFINVTVTLVGVSLLTTIYGIAVEERTV